MTIPSLAQVEHARTLLEGIAQITPIQRSKALGEFAGHDVFLKCENLQSTGSYKVRGAYVRMSSLSPKERRSGVVAASAGNHAQGVALAARELGITATIFMPVGVALPKLQATKSYGAHVVLEGFNVGESLAAAKAFAADHGATFIPPYDDLEVVTGAATVGLEVYEQVPSVETVVVPVGGGGLIAGIATAIKQRAAVDGRTVRVVGVQSENASAYSASLAEGRPVTIELRPTIADGIAVGRPGDVNFGIIREYVDEIVTVSDDDIARAILLMLERAKLVVEPAGAAAEAAIQSGKVYANGTVVAIASGGNIDPMLLQRIIRHGLSASSRYTSISIMLPDRPGQLAIISKIVAKADANVVEVMHSRHGKGLDISEVELQISIETKGVEHRDAVIRKLHEAGYEPRIDS